MALWQGIPTRRTIAHRKGAVDAKRGKLFSKLCRKIYVGRQERWRRPQHDLPLRYAIDKARSYICPKDTSSDRSRRGPASWPPKNFEEVTYEGYGPGGVAVLCEVLTDNRNRTAGDLRKAFEICGREPSAPMAARGLKQ